MLESVTFEPVAAKKTREKQVQIQTSLSRQVKGRVGLLP